MPLPQKSQKSPDIESNLVYDSWAFLVKNVISFFLMSENSHTVYCPRNYFYYFSIKFLTPFEILMTVSAQSKILRFLWESCM